MAIKNSRNQKREKLLRLLMEAQLIMQNELTPNEVAKTIRHYDLDYLEMALNKVTTQNLLSMEDLDQLDDLIK